MDWRNLLTLLPLLVVSCIYAQECPWSDWVDVPGSDPHMERRFGGDGTPPCSWEERNVACPEWPEWSLWEDVTGSSLQSRSRSRGPPCSATQIENFQQSCLQNILIAVDTSSSVSSRRFTPLKEGLILMLRNVDIREPATHVGICYFGTTAEAILPLVPFHTHAEVNAIIRASTPLRGRTMVSLGCQCLHEEWLSSTRPGTHTVCVLLIDGNPGDPLNDALELQNTRSCINNLNNTVCDEFIIFAIGNAFTDIAEIESWKDPLTSNNYFHAPSFAEFREFFEAENAFPIQCPIDGQWSQWDRWSDCSTTCGGGRRVRVRTCTNPMPTEGGSDCDNADDDSDVGVCNPSPCSVVTDGGWDTWTTWNVCSVTCGRGRRGRRRGCTRPVPANGGRNCVGNALGEDICQLDSCPRCEEPSDIYIVLTCSDTIVDLPQLMNGARNGLAKWFDSIRADRGPNCGPRVSLCCYGAIAEEQITPDGPLDASLIGMVGGSSRLNLGIECARLSSQANRRPGACQCMALIVSEDPQGFQGADAAREQIALARSRGFDRITLTTVTNNVYGESIEDFADPGFWLNMEDVDFREFENRTATTDLGNQLHCCRDDGGWGTWSAWTVCPVTCGNGRRSRRRACTRPRPAHGGQYCVGDSQDEDTCRKDPCLIPCNDRFRVEAVVRQCTPKLMAGQIRNVKDWRAVCQEQHDAIQSGIECLLRSTHCTKREAEALLITGSHCFNRMVCNEGVLNQEFQTMLDDNRFNQDLIGAIDFTRCLELQKLNYIQTLYCMRDVIDIELTELNNKLARLVAQFLIGCAVLMEDLSSTSDYYDFALLPRCSMRIWGEPHIETCNDEDGWQTTCSAPGLQTYLDLPFLKITGNNTHPYNGTRITWLSELTIEFKSMVPPHPVTARYKAANQMLPVTFEFLANQVSEIDAVRLSLQSVSHSIYGIYGNRDAVPVLVWPHTGVEIILTTWGGPYGAFYQFAMRASQAAMNTGTGILIDGCPEDEELRRRRRSTAGIRKRDEDEASAEAACLSEGIPPNTGDMEACMFDVIAMNDTSIAEATSMSIVDRNMTVRNDAERSPGAGVLSIPTGSEFDTADCVPNEFLSDPTDCSRYYQCLGYGKAILRKCIPKILHFNLATGRCDWRWKVRCQVASAGNGP